MMASLGSLPHLPLLLVAAHRLGLVMMLNSRPRLEGAVIGELVRTSRLIVLERLHTHRVRILVITIDRQQQPIVCVNCL